MAIALNTIIASTHAPAQPAAVIPFPRDHRDAIRAGRKPLPSHELTDVPLRRFVTSVCQAEINHAHNDFWQVVDGINARGLFYGETGADVAFRFPHEARAGEALVWLSHLQAHDNDRHGASIVRDHLERWNRWDHARKAGWLQRRRYLVHGLIRAANAYRAARSRELGGAHHDKEIHTTARTLIGAQSLKLVRLISNNLAPKVRAAGGLASTLLTLYGHELEKAEAEYHRLGNSSSNDAAAAYRRQEHRTQELRGLVAILTTLASTLEPAGRERPSVSWH